MFKDSRSASNLSLDSIEEEEFEPWHGLIHKLSPFHLNGLHTIFKEKDYKPSLVLRNQTRDNGLTKEEFVYAIEEVFGSCKYSLQATIMFSAIDKEDNHTITWNQFLDFLIENSNPRRDPKVELSLGSIFSPPHVKCVTYYSAEALEENRNFLFMGDDHGQILSLSFLQPKVSLLRRKHNDKLSLFYWSELQNETDFITIKNYGKVHTDSVKAIYFFPDNSTIASCSRDVNASVVIKHLENRRKTYVFKINRGASCFSISRFLKIIVTGSDDGMVQIWNLVVTSKPIAILKGHENGIIDIQILESQEIVLSCSRDGIVKVWVVHDETCIQTINIKFPSFGVLGKSIEWGINSIYPGPKRCVQNLNTTKNSQIANAYNVPSRIWERSHIFVTCCNYMAHINLIFREYQQDFTMAVLPPPPLQNSVLIPSNWHIEIEDVDAKSCESKIEEVDEECIAKYMESLKFILDKKQLFSCNKQNINYLIATLETKKQQMKNAVSKCAPYLALDLQQVQEIKLSPNLPVPSNKRTKNLVANTHRMLSAASSRSQVFSESSSGSRSKSSRSSVISFD